MGRFADEFDQIAGSSRFTSLELSKMFATDEERALLVQVNKALREAATENEQIVKVRALGDKAFQVVLKLSKMALAA